MLLMMYRPIQYLEYCGRKFGKYFTARSLTRPPLVVLSDPELVEDAYRASYDALTAYPGNSIFLRLLGEQSFVFQKGEQHRAGRKPLMPMVARTSTPDLPSMMYGLSEDAMSEWLRARRVDMQALRPRITADLCRRSVNLL